jgi:hypothetical protein
MSTSSRSTSSPRRATTRPSARGGTLEARTKEDLYAQARKVGINGRSTMTKSELIHALRRR